MLELWERWSTIGQKKALRDDRGFPRPPAEHIRKGWSASDARVTMSAFSKHGNVVSIAEFGEVPAPPESATLPKAAQLPYVEELQAAQTPSRLAMSFGLQRPRMSSPMMAELKLMSQTQYIAGD